MWRISPSYGTSGSLVGAAVGVGSAVGEGVGAAVAVGDGVGKNRSSAASPLHPAKSDTSRIKERKSKIVRFIMAS